MKNESLIHDALIENTIHLIGTGGFEAATTRAITSVRDENSDIKLNEVYIYRIFGGKEQLYAAAFERLNAEMVIEMSRDLEEFQGSDQSIKRKFYVLFIHLWRFLLGDEARCRAYVRFYYSIYFDGMVKKKYNEHFDYVVKRFSPFFKSEANVTALLHSILATLLDFAIRVYNVELSDSDDSAIHIFNVLYSSLESYFKAE